MKTKVRLQKIIAQRSDLSRRKAEAAIEAGRIAVNGKRVSELGIQVDPVHDRISLDGRPLRLSSRPIYIAYYKPKERIVSTHDPQGRRTIWDDLPRWKGRVKAAGRLDYDAEGLLLLSNDGDFLQRISHPSHELQKIYQAKVRDIPDAADLAHLKKGIRFDAEAFAPAEVSIVKQEGRHTWLRLAVHEGKYHQVKRMCESIGHPVVKLRRVAIGPIHLRQLERGMWRFLTRRELTKLGIIREAK